MSSFLFMHLCMHMVLFNAAASYRWRTVNTPDLDDHNQLFMVQNSTNYYHSWSQQSFHSQAYNEKYISSFSVQMDMHTLHISTNTSGNTCNGNNPLLGTCGVKNWVNNNEPNYQLCQTNWINKRGRTVIPYCGATSTQICLTLGIKRSAAGKPISCKTASIPTSQGRTWFVEVGDGSECKVACFDDTSMGRYTVSEVIYSGDTPSHFPLCLPDNIYLNGLGSHCSTSQSVTDTAWQVEALPQYGPKECSGRCYSERPTYMFGLWTFHSPTKLPFPLDYPICYLSDISQTDNSDVGSCQVSMMNDHWWFEQDGSGINCKVACSCRDNGSPYCKEL